MWATQNLSVNSFRSTQSTASSTSMPPSSIEHPLAYYRNNVISSQTVIECAVKGGVKHFVFFSTAAVYGIPSSTPVSEKDQTQPISPYGWSKLMTEVMLRDTDGAHGLRYVALRYFNVAGAAVGPYRSGLA
jgi:UDP-glucose 4-epimerase